MHDQLGSNPDTLERGWASRQFMNHATITVGEYTIPLIGLPTTCVRETCDRCKKDFHIQEVEFVDDQILCFECLNLRASGESQSI